MYQAEISRQNPALFVFLLDQSGSMSEKWGDLQLTKAEGAADAINRMLSNWVIRCSQGEVVRDYFYISVIGYGAEEGQAKPALSGELFGKKIVRISELANFPARVEDRVIKQPDGAGGIVELPVKFPIWFEPVSNMDTPMCEAIRVAKQILLDWVREHDKSFPPIVINITDGEATDGDPLPLSKDLRNVETIDGKALFFNCHISSKKGAKVLFPNNIESVSDKYGKVLFEMSSELPSQMLEAARDAGFSIGSGARGFAFQADLVDLVMFIDIGTRQKLR